MRVAITGASGNTGTAVLRALDAEPAVTSLVGVARRVPRANGTSTVAYPHDRAEWVRCDLGDDSPSTHDALLGAFNHADVVIHLAWAKQPSHDADRLDAVNIDGTQRVLDAAAEAGASHVVIASSAGVYAPSPDDVARDESWARTGVPGSLHSHQKLQVERLLDAFAREHPAITVARVRSTLVLQRDAASELARDYLGGVVPPRLLRRDHPPVLVWPRGLRMQAIQADDLAAAYRAIVVGRFPGAFNVAAPDVLTAQQVADAIGTEKVREVDPKWFQRALGVAWRAHVAPLAPDWLDLALSLPVLDTTRASATLRWRAAHSIVDVLRDVAAGVGKGDGFSSPPLVPRKV